MNVFLTYSICLVSSIHTLQYNFGNLFRKLQFLCSLFESYFMDSQGNKIAIIVVGNDILITVTLIKSVVLLILLYCLEAINLTE